MAKSNYLPFILSIAAVWLCCHFSGDTVEQGFGGSNTPGYVSVVVNTPLTEKRFLLNAVYNGEVGVRERSNRNDGDRVEQYLAYTGNRKGDPWCAAFVCWAFGKAGVANPRSAWSPDLLPASRLIWKNNRMLKKEPPQSGDVFGIWFSDKGRIAHCGFIAGWGPVHTITVEGNTNESGSREGDGVYRKRRLTKSLYAVADWLSRKEWGDEI